MRFMKGNCLSEPPPPSVDISSASELNRSDSDASTLTAENGEDILLHSANVKPEMGTKWTDEKHSLYLKHLEVSFVKQLHQSIGLLSQCSDQNNRDKDSTVMRPVNVNNASEKVEFTTELHGCWEEINYNSGDPLSHASPDSLSPMKSPWVYRSKRIRMHTPAASFYIPRLSMHCDTENHRKAVASRGCGSQCHGDSHYIRREGTGQNFVDEDNETNSNTQKRLKTALPD